MMTTTGFTDEDVLEYLEQNGINGEVLEFVKEELAKKEAAAKVLEDDASVVLSGVVTTTATTSTTPTSDNAPAQRDDESNSSGDGDGDIDAAGVGDDGSVSNNEEEEEEEEQEEEQNDNTVHNPGQREDVDVVNMSLLDLPEDVFGNIFDFVGPCEFRFVGGTCKKLNTFYKGFHSDEATNRHRAVLVIDEDALTRLVSSPSRMAEYERYEVTARYPTTYQKVVESISRADFYLSDRRFHRRYDTHFLRYEVYADQSFEEGGGHPIQDLTRLATEAARWGDLQVLVHAMAKHELFYDDEPPPISLWEREELVDNIRNNAAANGHLHIIKCTKHQTRIPFKDSALYKAIDARKMDVISWLLENGDLECKPGPILYALGNKNLEESDSLRIADLLYANRFPCYSPPDEDDGYDNMFSLTCDGRLQAIQWLRQHDCPWDSGSHNVCDGALLERHFGLFKWAVENGCPWWRSHVRARAARWGYTEFVAWIDVNPNQTGVPEPVLVPPIFPIV